MLNIEIIPKKLMRLNVDVTIMSIQSSEEIEAVYLKARG